MYETSGIFNIELQTHLGLTRLLKELDNDVVHASVYIVQSTTALSLSYDFASGSDITTCIKIYKALVLYLTFTAIMTVCRGPSALGTRLVVYIF